MPDHFLITARLNPTQQGCHLPCTTLHCTSSVAVPLGIALPSTLSARASCGLCLTRCPVTLIACSVLCSHLLSVYLPLSLFPFLAPLLSTPISPFSVFFLVCLSNMSFMPCREVSIFNGLWPLSVTLYISLPLHVSAFLSLSLLLLCIKRLARKNVKFYVRIFIVLNFVGFYFDHKICYFLASFGSSPFFFFGRFLAVSPLCVVAFNAKSKRAACQS